MSITLILMLIVIGAAVGLLTAVFGVGGGFLLVPALTKLIGLPFDAAATLSLCFIMGASLSGLYLKIKLGDFDKKVLVYTLPTAVAGVILGDIIKDSIKNHLGNDIDIFNHTMMLIFAIFLILIAFIILYDVLSKSNPKLSLFFRLKPLVALNPPAPSVSLISLLFCGLAVGFLSGLLGVGGGIIFIPLLVMGMKMPLNKAAGTSLGLVFIIAFIGIIKKGLPNDLHVSLIMLALLLIGSFIGIRGGIVFAKKQNDKTLKMLFSMLVFIMSLLIIISEYMYSNF
ncbi:MAG: sulfite exporter TauE/SafE family protein [Alphaproteobacteria bacterium]|nr:sulfite exporter TauE/SafE family protein [Alphaproteobacteria bacterium]